MSKGIGREQIRRCMIIGWKGDVIAWTVSINSTPSVRSPLVLATVARRDCQWRFRLEITQAGEEIVDQLGTAGHDKVRVGSTVRAYVWKPNLHGRFVRRDGCHPVMSSGFLGTRQGGIVQVMNFEPLRTKLVDEDGFVDWIRHRHLI